MGHQEDIAKTESKIIVIRDTQVILDRDVAELYGVETVYVVKFFNYENFSLYQY